MHRLTEKKKKQERIIFIFKTTIVKAQKAKYEKLISIHLLLLQNI